MTASRIPLSLQTVFLKSNSGDEVNDAPAENVAAKTFRRSYTEKEKQFYVSKITWLFKNKLKLKKKRGGAKNDMADVCSVTTKLSDETNEPLAKVPEKIQIKAPIDIVKAGSKTATSQKLPQISPQDYLNNLLTSRGYANTSKRTLESGYYAAPTHLQKASYHGHLISLARDGKKSKLKDIMECGISPNPCNSHGESLLHTVCRRCDAETLQILVDAGASVQVSDDYGRTPLHDACWRPEPCFDVIEIIANKDLGLFQLKDSRGSLPLSYVHKEHWEEWNNFLESKVDIWWPVGNESRGSALVNVGPNTRPIQDPENGLKPEVAAMVTAGRISPHDALKLNMDLIDNDAKKDEDDYNSEEDSDYSECSDEDISDEESFSEYLSDDMSDFTESSDGDESFSMAADDMADIIGLAQFAKDY